MLFPAVIRRSRSSLRHVVTSTRISSIAITSTVAAASSTKSKTSPWNPGISQLIRKENLVEARGAFDRLPAPNVYQYTVMITAYARAGYISDALQLFDQMPERDVASWNSMIKGCLQCGELSLARQLFDTMPHRNVISWTTIVDGLARSGRIDEAEELFLRMPWRDVAAWNSMITGYCINGRVADALWLFERMSCRNVISWTAMIGGLDQNGRSKDALCFFGRMLNSGMVLTSNTFASVVTACANAMDICLGFQLHAHLLKSGSIFDTFISTSLITLSANCNQIDNSRKIFEEVSHKTVVSWTALITGFGSNGRYQCAVDTFQEMKSTGIVPNQSSFTSILNSIGELENLYKGKEIHGNAIKLGFGFDLFVGNSLIFMYSKCGELDDAMTVFNKLSERNIVSWNSVITGCAQNGYGILALEFYKRMILNLIQPDAITFVGLLTACSHSKMVDRARYFFRQLSQEPCIHLKLEHCICMIDVLGRSGNLEEAEELINNMPLKPDVAVWLTLLSACRGSGNIEVARRAAENIFWLDSDCSAAYILLSNVYASAGLWDDVSRIRMMMKCRGIIKEPGHSVC